MKGAFASLFALAGATAPPTISLNLEGMANAYKLKESIVRQHDLDYRQNDNTKVVSRQDWTEKCAANLAGVSKTECPFPVANAYDHHDGLAVSVTCRLFLVDDSNRTISTPEQQASCKRTSVDFTRRSTYLFKYDAADKAGNHAEQVVFALILNDIEAPKFNEAKCADAITVEAATDWSLCEQTANDNIDGDRTANIQYRIQEVQADTFNNIREMMPTGIWGDYAEAKQVFTPHTGDGAGYVCDAKLNCGPLQLGKFLVTAKVTDAAGVYGHNAVDNIATTHVAIVVQDSRPPVIQVNGHSPVYHECISDKNFKGAQANARRPCPAKDTGRGIQSPIFKGESDPVLDATDFYCGFNYIDDGADALDQYDTWARKYTTQVYDAGCIDCPEVAAGSDAARVYISAKKSERKSTNARGTTVTDTTFFNKLADNEQTKTRSIKFDAVDEIGNVAKSAIRKVTTVDTIAPALTLHAPKLVDRYEGFFTKKLGQANMYHHKVHSSHGNDIDKIIAEIDPSNSVTAHDWCDDDRLTITRSWGPRAFNARVLGHYVRTYSTVDLRKNEAKVVRTFNVIDEEVPTIDVIYSDSKHAIEAQTFEATRDTEYTDEGATCNDYVDGELSHAVEVSGEVVNMRIPGTYLIQYDCSDLSGNPAASKKRTIVIQDTTCPELSLTSSSLQYVEAGFPYVDAGATATDTLDGDITQYIWTDGNTVNHKQAFYSKRSCAEIQTSCNKEGTDYGLGGTCKSGEYYITTVRTVAGKQRFHRQLVHCWMEQKPAVTFKIFQLGDCETVLSELGMPASTNCHKQDMCPLIGMKQNRAVSKALANYINVVAPAAHLTFTGAFGHHGDHSDVYKTQNGQQTGSWYGDSTYVCMEQDRVDTNGHQYYGDNVEGTNGGKMTNAEQGKYIIQFHVSDKAGNHECKTQSRTVIVKDTLPPVITLSLNNKLIHNSAGNQKGMDNQPNPAGLASMNPNFMAEVVTSNSWIVGAIASAVAGVALLSYGSRSSTVSVPV